MDKSFPLVSSTWLNENLEAPALIIIDVSMKAPVISLQSAQIQIIPNSQAFDWGKFSDHLSALPNMMPTAEQFTEAAQALGINNNSLVVVYDRTGIYSSARVWWMFLTMGFKNCYVLDGGLPDWLSMNYECTNEYITFRERGNFLAKYNPHLIASRDDVSDALSQTNKHVIDVRSEDRFNGRIKESRAGLKSGHIPNSINIPFEKLLVDQKIRGEADLKILFENFNEVNNQLIFSCGSGVTACIGALAAVIIGYPNVCVYDGSWSEWGNSL